MDFKDETRNPIPTAFHRGNRYLRSSFCRGKGKYRDQIEMKRYKEEKKEEKTNSTAQMPKPQPKRTWRKMTGGESSIEEPLCAHHFQWHEKSA
jgi:hypothetical protein